MKDKPERILKQMGTIETHTGKGDCPAFETLLAYHFSSLPSSQKQAVHNHILYCDSCAKELIALEDAARAVSRKSSGWSLRAGFLALKPFAFFGHHRGWSLSLGFATALCLVIILVRPLWMDTDTYRGDPSPQQFYAISPRGDSGPVTSFSWRPVPHADTYSITVFDPDYTILWSRKNIQGTSMEIPVTLELKPDQTYTWLLTAYRRGTVLHEESNAFNPGNPRRSK